MALHYVNTGTALGALPMLKRDVNSEFAKPPTGTFEYLLFNLRGMETVFNGLSTAAGAKYPQVHVVVPDQYVINEFLQESAERNRGQGRSAVDSMLLSRFIPGSSINNLQLNAKDGEGIDLRDSKSYNQLYKVYQQAFEIYNRMSSNARSHANQVYNSTVEAFKKLRSSVYRRDNEVGVQGEYRPKLRAKFSNNARRVLEYLRNHGNDYLKAIKKRHLPAHDISVKGLEALLQEA